MILQSIVKNDTVSYSFAASVVINVKNNRNDLPHAVISGGYFKLPVLLLYIKYLRFPENIAVPKMSKLIDPYLYIIRRMQDMKQRTNVYIRMELNRLY